LIILFHDFNVLKIQGVKITSYTNKKEMPINKEIAAALGKLTHAYENWKDADPSIREVEDAKKRLSVIQ